MDAGGHAQSNPNSFAPHGLGMPSSGLASRRGGQNIKPLSFDALKPVAEKETVPTPRTARGHLLAGLRTAPKSAAAATFPASPTTLASPTTQMFSRNNVASIGYAAQNNVYNAPKTALPRYGNQPGYNSLMGMSRQYTPEQVLAPPEIRIDEGGQEQMDPHLYAELVATNAYLAQQQQQLQQQLMNVQAAAQHFQGLSLNGATPQQVQQQQFILYQQQQQLQQLRTFQQQMVNQAMGNQQQQQQQQQQSNVYAYYDPTTGQSTYYMAQNTPQQINSPYNVDQSQAGQSYAALAQMQQNASTPRVQVSPPPENHASPFRSNSPPKRFDSPGEPTPLPPPSANAFRRGHKKASSLAVNSSLTLATQDVPRSAGPKSAVFPLTPLTGGYGPGQARAGEHPIRQPRGPPSFDELKSKPTTKHEGSKNFATRTRRSAVHNLVRAGLERRKGTGSSSGSMSPVSESAEESSTPITDNESDSGRSGSGSLSGDMDCSLPSSRASISGSWGAIGSDRPSSRQKARKSVDSVSSVTSGCESDSSSFASVFKNGAQRPSKGVEPADGQRKAPMLVLTSAEKRKSGI
jgi:hypothetical protein